MNPYNWRGNRPRVEVSRESVERVGLDLKRGGSGVLMAGRGMGKSVFLWQIHDFLRELPDTVPVFVPGPPDDLSVPGCVRALARRLGIDEPEPRDTEDLVERFFARRPDDHLVLIYDELNRYASLKDDPARSVGKHFFNNLEVLRRTYEPRLGIFAAGGLGVFLFRDVLGSTFMARAEGVRVSPFGRRDIVDLARPFFEDGRPPADGVVEALQTTTGGVPALVTYGLESLWSIDEPKERDVADAFAVFQDRHREFIRDFQSSFADPELSGAPARALDIIQRSEGKIRREDLVRACTEPDGALRLGLDDVLDVLQATGLISIGGSIRADPIRARPVAGILTLPNAPSSHSESPVRLRADLLKVLGRLHAAGADFFRPGTGGQGKALVPEAVFSAYLALGLQLLGWRVEREAQQGAGRTDLKLRWGTDELALVEVKIWGRDHGTVLSQLESYWTPETVAGAVVMLTDRDVTDWPAKYKDACLKKLETLLEEESPASAVPTRITSKTSTIDGLKLTVDHFLLRIPRRT